MYIPRTICYLQSSPEISHPRSIGGSIMTPAMQPHPQGNLKVHMNHAEL